MVGGSNLSSVSSRERWNWNRGDVMTDKFYTQNICRLGHYFTSDQSNGKCLFCQNNAAFSNKVVIDGEMERGVILAINFDQFIIIPQEINSEGKILLPAIHKIPVRDEMNHYRQDICAAWPEELSVDKNY